MLSRILLAFFLAFSFRKLILTYTDNNINTNMIQIKIQLTNKKLIYNLLFNSNKLTNIFYINNNILNVNKQDINNVIKLLNSNIYINKYTIL